MVIDVGAEAISKVQGPKELPNAARATPLDPELLARIKATLLRDRGKRWDIILGMSKGSR